MRKRHPKSLRLRLTGWFFCVFAFILGISDWLIYKKYKVDITSSIDENLAAFAEEIEHAILKTNQPLWRKEITNVRDEFLTSKFFVQIMEKINNNTSVEYKVISKSEVIKRSQFPEGLLSYMKTLDDTPQFLNVIFESMTPHPLRVVVFPVLRKGKSDYIILVGTSLKKAQQSLNRLLIIFFISTPIILLFSTVGTYFIVSRAIDPLKKIVDVAQKITTQDLSMRVFQEKSSYEFDQLVKTFNHMICRLEESVKQIKQFSSEVSHEIKTPLTVIKGELGLFLHRERTLPEYKSLLRRIEGEIEKLATLVDNMLLLSQSEFAEKRAAFRPVPLFEVLANTLEDHNSQAKERKVNIRLKKIDAVYIDGIDFLLKRMFSNLIDNAIDYSNPGGTVELELKKGAAGIQFNISDAGIGIPQEAIPHVFDRFYRVENTKRQGSGLGLSIVKWICDLHGAVIDVKSEMGKGTQMVVTFPKHAMDEI
jgi:heavy metal sensor kinase